MLFVPYKQVFTSLISLLGTTCAFIAYYDFTLLTLSYASLKNIVQVFIVLPANIYELLNGKQMVYCSSIGCKVEAYSLQIFLLRTVLVGLTVYFSELFKKNLCQSGSYRLFSIPYM